MGCKENLHILQPLAFCTLISHQKKYGSNTKNTLPSNAMQCRLSTNAYNFSSTPLPQGRKLRIKHKKFKKSKYISLTLAYDVQNIDITWNSWKHQSTWTFCFIQSNWYTNRDYSLSKLFMKNIHRYNRHSDINRHNNIVT